MCYSPELVEGSIIGGNDLVLMVAWPNTLDFSGGEGLGREELVLVDLLTGLGLIRIIEVTGAWGVAAAVDASTTDRASCDIKDETEEYPEYSDQEMEETKKMRTDLRPALCKKKKKENSPLSEGDSARLARELMES